MVAGALYKLEVLPLSPGSSNRAKSLPLHQLDICVALIANIEIAHYHYTATNIPLTANNKLLMHLPIPPPPGWLETVAARYPSLKVHWEVAHIEGGIRDIQGVETLPPEVLEGVTMVCVYPPARPESVPNVRYVQLASAGYDR